MPISHDAREKLLQATKPAAEAFMEDVEHIRSMLARDEVSKTQLRHLSSILRRLLIDGGGDIRSIAPPRIGKMLFDVPDNTYFYNASQKREVSIFLSGGVSIFGLEYRAIIVCRPALEMNKHDEVVRLPLDGFLNQKVVCFNQEWVNRRDVIKYVANIASGVHSGSPTSKTDIILSRVRQAVTYTPSEHGAVRLDFDFLAFSQAELPFKYSKDGIDSVLVELYAAAHILVTSPDVFALEHSIKSEFS